VLNLVERLQQAEGHLRSGCRCQVNISQSRSQLEQHQYNRLNGDKEACIHSVHG
jgi:hypothetical protein